MQTSTSVFRSRIPMASLTRKTDRDANEKTNKHVTLHFFFFLKKSYLINKNAD